MRAEAGIGSPTAALPFLLRLLRSTRETILREGIATKSEIDIDAIEQRLSADLAAQRCVTTGGFEVKAWARKR